jgi:hypothetical protein
MSTFPPIADYGLLSNCEQSCLVAQVVDICRGGADAQVTAATVPARHQRLPYARLDLPRYLRLPTM